MYVFKVIKPPKAAFKGHKKSNIRQGKNTTVG